MLSFTGGYINKNNNFKINNIILSGSVKPEERVLICVLKNILFRGSTTVPSKYLESMSGFLNDDFLTAIFRFQTTLLSMLENGLISLNDRTWRFRILNRENIDFAQFAVDDLFLWIEHLSKLQKIKIRKPNLSVSYVNSIDSFKKDHFINIDFSIHEEFSESDSLSQHITVRSDYSDNDYFSLSTAEPIKYNIITDGKDTDIPSMEFLLQNIFRFKSFRQGQLPIIINALSGEDTLGILPTGSGKSLCYQFCALLQPCISFIVCPIKALMYDQFESMQKIGITRNNYISSDQEGTQKTDVMNDYIAGKYNFIWISPERFQNKSFVRTLEKINYKSKVMYAVIDEVHCLSEWGHDFRTSYLCLIDTIRNSCPYSKFIGLTATASSYVLRDLKSEFGIDSGNIKTLQKFSRNELTFSVKTVHGANYNAKKIALFDILDELNKKQDIFTPNGSDTNAGLIFTLNVNGPFGCYEVSKEVSRRYGIPHMWYAGGIPKDNKKPIMDYEEFNAYRLEAQENYKNNQYPILVSTKAFGMGIDKANIRYTIHYGMPASLESLYQEAGRAGRDGKQAECYIIRSTEIVDKRLLNKLFARETSVEEIRRIQELVGFKGNDVFSNFFLWLGHNKGVNAEYKSMTKLFNTYAKPNSSQWIYCSTLGEDLETIQKAIYRLCLLGIVDYWFVENWDQKSGILEVKFGDYSIELVKKYLSNYIEKYDPDNGFEKIFENYAVTGKYESYFMTLLDWTYDTIVYQRRQSIKTIYERCEHFTTSEEFKQEIDNYFKYNDNSVILDKIAFNKSNPSDWIEVFYRNNNFISLQEINEVRGSLARYLESFKNNTGLNFISGLVRLFLDDYLDVDGRSRFQSAFKNIRNYDDIKKEEILSITLKIAENLQDAKNKTYLRRLLYREYPFQKDRIRKAIPYSRRT